MEEEAIIAAGAITVGIADVVTVAIVEVYYTTIF
jgi:hypothetical protein